MYLKKNLVVKLLFENTSKNEIMGIKRYNAYMNETGNYCTLCKIDITRNPILPREQKVITAILESPVGFGKYLKETSLLIIKDGIYEEGRAIVLDILGNMDEFTQQT